MTNLELNQALKTLGWKGVDVGRRLGLNPNTVSNWRVGHAPVPGYVAEYLRVALLAKAMLDG